MNGKNSKFDALPFCCLAIPYSWILTVYTTLAYFAAFWRFTKIKIVKFASYGKKIRLKTFPEVFCFDVAYNNKYYRVDSVETTWTLETFYFWEKCPRSHNFGRGFRWHINHSHVWVREEDFSIFDPACGAL